MLSAYIIHVECDDIMLSHHLQLDIAWDFTYATNEILVVWVGCNLFLLKLFFLCLLFSFKTAHVGKLWLWNFQATPYFCTFYIHILVVEDSLTTTLGKYTSPPLWQGCTLSLLQNLVRTLYNSLIRIEIMNIDDEIEKTHWFLSMVKY